MIDRFPAIADEAVEAFIARGDRLARAIEALPVAQRRYTLAVRGAVLEAIETRTGQRPAYPDRTQPDSRPASPPANPASHRD